MIIKMISSTTINIGTATSIAKSTCIDKIIVALTYISGPIYGTYQR